MVSLITRFIYSDYIKLISRPGPLMYFNEPTPDYLAILLLWKP